MGTLNYRPHFWPPSWILATRPLFFWEHCKNLIRAIVANEKIRWKLILWGSWGTPPGSPTNNINGHLGIRYFFDKFWYAFCACAVWSIHYAQKQEPERVQKNTGFQDVHLYIYHTLNILKLFNLFSSVLKPIKSCLSSINNFNILNYDS